MSAGIEPKLIAEKWLSIRRMLRADIGLPDDCPEPTAELKEEMTNNYFLPFLNAWNRYPELRGGRKSLPNINFLFVQFMLLIGTDVYALHAPWFPQVTPAKLQKLVDIWGGYCVVLGWPHYVAEYDKAGQLHRRLVNTVAQAPPIRVKRPPVVTGPKTKRRKLSIVNGQWKLDVINSDEESVYLVRSASSDRSPDFSVTV